MEGRYVIDVEGVMDEVLGLWHVELVGIVVDALDDLKRSVTSGLELGVAFLRERSLRKWSQTRSPSWNTKGFLFLFIAAA